VLRLERAAGRRPAVLHITTATRSRRCGGQGLCHGGTHAEASHLSRAWNATNGLGHLCQDEPPNSQRKSHRQALWAAVRDDTPNG